MKSFYKVAMILTIVAATVVFTMFFLGKDQCSPDMKCVPDSIGQCAPDSISQYAPLELDSLIADSSKKLSDTL